ncbi:MAG: amidohydrolase [Deltaproteobacteria bacterium]|nr:MAG: amidohydrolase [Deltaproteobacteria bacterium]
MPSDTRDFHRWLIDIRRDFHRHPELSHHETRTTNRIIDILGKMGIDTRRLDGMTGAIGLITGATSGKTIALRADIDALPLTELNTSGYRSEKDGVMHACGHDAHATIMLGVARKIIDTGLMKKRPGQVKFLFQPAEERVAGARAMIRQGVLENPSVDRVIAAHVTPQLEVGKIGIFENLGFAAADRFVLTLTGKGGHGARPEECIDPIVAGAHFITQAQSIISRNIKALDAGVITVGKFMAGAVSNIIPETAVLEGTIRSLKKTVRTRLIDRLNDLADGLEKTFGVQASFVLHEGVPPGLNDKTVSADMFQAAAAIVGQENVSYIPPVMGAEDFAYFTQARPGAMIRLGCANHDKGIDYPLHSPRFDMDEKVLDIGVEIFYEAITRYLSE